MFSPTSSINPFANYSSSYLHFPPLFAGCDNNEVSINHQHDPLAGLLLPDNPRIPESLTNMAFAGKNAAMIKQDFDSLNAEYYDAPKFAPCSKKPVKKDRHSKIYTAQGLRDRRVRLSIAISRQFFDLQDMLGFDKASKTLGWLLNKSRNAIKELAELKSTCNIGCAKGEVMYENGDLEGNDSRSKLLEKISEEKKMEKLHNTALLPAKESRDKARARARQRTLQKMCQRRLHEYNKKVPDTLIQFRSLSQFKASHASNSSAHNFTSSLNVVSEVKEQFCSHELASKAPMEDVSEQGSNSNVLKGKQIPSSIAYQQNLEIAKDLSCNNSNYNVNLHQNWDMINSAMRQYFPFRAITTNANPSAGRVTE